MNLQQLLANCTETVPDSGNYLPKEGTLLILADAEYPDGIITGVDLVVKEPEEGSSDSEFVIITLTDESAQYRQWNFDQHITKYVKEQ